jgi:predicted membrane channel-forming protein YqfA (hemolysin III family)
MFDVIREIYDINTLAKEGFFYIIGFIIYNFFKFFNCSNEIYDAFCNIDANLSFILRAIFMFRFF